MNKGAVLHVLVLLVLGAGWGITMPLTKIAVSTGHGHFGLIFWQLVIGAVFMAGVVAMRGRPWPALFPALGVAVVIALIGTVVPNSASYQAVAHLPSGVMSILLSLIPMIAFPIALGLGLERFRVRRLFGLLLGLGGVMMLLLPEASLPDRDALVWIPVALIAAICYAFEGNYVSRWGTGGLDPIQLLFLASVTGAIIVFPLALMSGQFISPFRTWAAPEVALVVLSAIHVSVYAGYVWLVGQAGAVFAVQVGYFVTGFGVLSAMAFLNESYSPYIWAALGLVLAGVYLVQSRAHDALAADASISENAS